MKSVLFFFRLLSAYDQLIELFSIIISCEVSRWALIGRKVFLEECCDPVRLVKPTQVSSARPATTEARGLTIGRVTNDEGSVSPGT